MLLDSTYLYLSLTTFLAKISASYINSLRGVTVEAL